MSAAPPVLAPAPPAGIRASGYLPELEALRGVAVLLVYTFHADRYFAIPLELAGTDTRGAVGSPLRAFIAAGHTGVTLFFVLSGFLLALPFLAEADGGPRVDRRRYAERRVLRILPLYWFLLAVGVLAAYAIAWGAWIAGHWGPTRGSEAYQLGLSLFGRGWVFLAGIAAAWCWRRHGVALRTWARGAPLLRRGGSDALLALVVLGLGAMLLWELRRPAVAVPIPPVVGWHLAEGVAWALVLLLVLLAPLRAAPVFRLRALTGLGVLSYSIYVWHVPILHYGLRAFRRWWGAPPRGWDEAGLVAYVAISAAVLAVSACSYAVVERPFLRRKARIAV